MTFIKFSQKKNDFSRALCERPRNISASDERLGRPNTAKHGACAGVHMVAGCPLNRLSGDRRVDHETENRDFLSGDRDFFTTTGLRKNATSVHSYLSEMVIFLSGDRRC